MSSVVEYVQLKLINISKLLGFSITELIHKDKSLPFDPNGKVAF